MSEVKVDEMLSLCAAKCVSSLLPSWLLPIPPYQPTEAGAGKEIPCAGDSGTGEVWLTVRHEATEISANNAVPGRALSLVKLVTQDVSCNAV